MALPAPGGKDGKKAKETAQSALDGLWSVLQSVKSDAPPSHPRVAVTLQTLLLLWQVPLCRPLKVSLSAVFKLVPFWRSD